jgi:DNA polymerase-1
MPSMPHSSPENFIIIDGHALIYRAYHAFTALSTSKGELVNAVYGFTRILLTVIRDFDPKYIAVTFDHHQPTFRHTDYLGYKSNRPEMPDDLKPQVDRIKEVVKAFNIPQFILPGFEADDLIGTIVCQLQEQKTKEELMVIVVTGDRDAFQLVNDQVHVWMPGRGKFSKDKEYDPQQVIQKMGVRPDQIIDLKALMGDASDRIPGVKGIGEKTAVKLIQEMESVENIYETIKKENLDFETSQHPLLKGSLLKKLAEGYQDALMSKQLATIECHSPITINIEECRTSSYKKDEVLKIFEELEFESLIKLLPADEFETGVQSALF